MSPQTHQKTEVVIARSKRTGTTYPVRIAHLSKHQDSLPQLLPDTEGNSAKPECPPQLHYLTKTKDTVCRCISRSHGSYKRVQNAEIRELCAEYFLIEETELTCTRDQWRATMQEPMQNEGPERDGPASMEFFARESKLGTFGEGKTTFVRPESSQSNNFLQAQEARLSAFGYRRETCFDEKTSFARPISSESDHEIHLRNGPGGEADIPEEMWRASRPSAYLGQYSSDSAVSTPIGSSVSQIYEKTDSRPNSLSILGFGTKAPGVHQHGDASCDAGLGVYFEPTQSPPSVSRPNTAELPVAEPEISRPSSSVYSPSPPQYSPTAEHPVTEPEVPRPSSSAYSPYLPHHSPTLRDLEGRGSAPVSEMPCRSTLLQKKIESRRLTKLVSQTPYLPTQEDFFLTHVEPCSRTNPAPVGDCTICQTPFDAPNKRTILLSCTHYFHQECLLTLFRLQDFEFGHCLVCGMALCERTLHDRIETDRVEIFGATTFTPLPSNREERIQFPMHSQTITCRSEEEVAAAQLRLLKDYIDSHANDVYRTWNKKVVVGEVPPAEPDWHGQLIVPVVSLFKGWNVPRRQCKLFPDRDAFYKVVAWAELVRLIGTLKDGLLIAYGPKAPFPSRAEMHRKFLMAKERYENEKMMWGAGRDGGEWDKVVKVMVGLTLGDVR